MQLSCLPVSLFSQIRRGEMGVGEWASEAAAMGLDAFDISILFVSDRTPAGLKKLKEETARSGLPLGMVTTYPDFTNPDPVARERELAFALADIEVSAYLGAELVRLTAGQHYSGQDEEQSLDWVCAAFEVCSRLAEARGVGLVWENHSRPGAWENPDFNFDRGRLSAMAGRMQGMGMGLNYDIANAWALGYGPELFRQWFPEIASIHVNDLESAEPLRFAGIGRGTAPVWETLALAAEQSFGGLVSVEEASMEGLAGVRRYVGAVKQYLAKLRQ